MASNMNIKTTSEVGDALETGAAVVALESTIITHGMPYPDNLTMAKDVEQVVRSEGAIPATIAVIDGALQIGLIEEQLEKLAQTNGVMKLSRADLAYAMATGRTGGTTVAATMMAAHLAGIELFATGGIGGVHRGAETTFDISADLEELGQTPVTVVSAGPKAILDIPKTIEFLETKGVPIVAFGQDELPAFWSQKVGIVAPLRLDTPEQMADLIAMRRDLKALHHGGILIANPIPAADEIAQSEIEAWIEAAMADPQFAMTQHKDITPFLLAKINELSDGRSLTANISLVKNNARLAAKIAVSRSENTRLKRIGFV